MVDIVEEGVADDSTFDPADVGVKVVLVGPQIDGELVAGGGDHQAELACVRAGGWRRYRALVHVNDVVAGRQVGEGVMAGGIGSDNAHDRLGTIHLAIAVGVFPKHDGHVCNACFTNVLHGVLVVVEPDKVADGAAPIVTEVGVGVGLVVEQSHVVGIGAADQVHSGANGGGNANAGGDDAGLIHLHQVVAPVEALELVRAGDAGRGGVHEDVAGVNDAVVVDVLVEIDRDAGQAILAGVYHAIFIGVQPDSIADAGRAGRAQAEVGVAELLPRGEGHLQAGGCGRLVVLRHRVQIERDGVGAGV